jgi:aminoglycoside 6'-N-acetyltransferase
MDNPWSPPNIRTDRLLIRPMAVSDLSSVHDYASSYPAERYGSWLGGTDPASVARYIADTVARYGRPPRCDLGITLNNQLVGGLAFRQVWITPPAMEVGWVVHPKVTGQGIAQEALNTLLKHLAIAFPRLSRFEARVHAEDNGARRTLDQLGFQAEGILRGGVGADGEAADGVMYSLLPRELSA